MTSKREKLIEMWNTADKRIPMYESKINCDFRMMGRKEKLDYRRHLAFKAIANELDVHYKDVVSLVHINVVNLKPMYKYNHWVNQGIKRAEDHPERYRL